MLSYIKLTVGYYLDEAVAEGSDAAEVMFTRGLAYCGGSRTGGRIPASVVPTLSRRPVGARRTANALVAAGLWRAEGKGFRVTNWDDYQDALDALDSRRKADRERKRRQRNRHVTVTPDVTGQSRDVTGEEEEEEEDAAAAAPDAAAAAVPLDPALDVLRSKLQSHTALRALRFDTLRPDQQTRLVHLIATHGDGRLVKTALDTCRTPPPIHVSAFLGTWESLPPPGKKMAAVPSLPASSDTPVQTAEGVATARELFEQIRKGGASS